MNAHVRLQLVSAITKESEKARNPICALGIMLRGLRQVDVYCRLGGTVEKAVSKFFNGHLLLKLRKAIIKGQKNADKAKEKGDKIRAEIMASIDPTNYLPQYQGREVDGDYSSWLVSNNMD
jgi:hypothetical protein